MKTGFTEIPEKEKRGLVAGYKPNRISLYILLLGCGRHKELVDLLYEDEKKFKMNNQKYKDIILKFNPQPLHDLEDRLSEAFYEDMEEYKIKKESK